MKMRLILALGLLLLILPSVSIAQTCGPANTIDLGAFLPNQQDNQLQLALTNYASYPEGGNYALCFVMPQLDISAADDVKSFTLTVGAAEAKNIYIVGVDLIKNNDLVSDTPLFTVVHSGTGTVYLKDVQLSNVKNGLSLSGTGKIELSTRSDEKVVVTGDSSKSGTCIDVKSPAAVLSAVEASSCHEGVKVDASDVKIKDSSRIYSNHLGVHALAGRARTSIKGSLVYANDDGNPSTLLREDGVRIDGGVMNEVVFYDMVNNEPTPLLDGDDQINYSNGVAYMLLDIPAGQSGTVELYYSKGDDCGLPEGMAPAKQPCGVLTGITNPVTVSAAELNGAMKMIHLPPQYYSKSIVAVYEDPVRGTAGISREFTGPEIVAFVANPYDIPTTGGAVDTGDSGDDEEDSGGNSMGGEGATTEGGGGIISAAGAAGGCGGGASLMGLAWSDASVGGILWCMGLAVATIASLRLVTAKAPPRRRHYH